jgi:exopolysaccharide biosynthesis polyprenyl glycosylphosphotransferase
VASASIHPRQKLAGSEWAARLIPGVEPGREQRWATPGTWLRPVLKDAGKAIFFNSVAGKPPARAEWYTATSGTQFADRNRNVLIVGAGSVGRRLAKRMADPALERTFCGFLDDRKALGKDVVGRTRDLALLARAVFIDEVILAVPHDRDLTLRLLREAQQLRLDVKIAPDLFGCEPVGAIENIGGVPVFALHKERLPVKRLLLKRALDLLGAAAALILLAPVMGLIAVLIRLDSSGPVFYTALRAGRKARIFRCYKFRTMVHNADDLKDQLRQENERSGPFFKMTNDPRITRVGGFLRRYSLDELPQLLNVLKGEMSLVGPRPHPLDDFSGYGIEHLPRLDVTPGMTGLWQVTSRRDPSFQAGIQLDLEYIRRWSLGMDLKILWKTAGAVLRGSGQ